MLRLIKAGNDYCLKILWVQVGYFASAAVFTHHFINHVVGRFIIYRICLNSVSYGFFYHKRMLAYLFNS